MQGIINFILLIFCVSFIFAVIMLPFTIQSIDSKLARIIRLLEQLNEK